MSDVIIRAEKLSKSYLLGHRTVARERYASLREVIAGRARHVLRTGADLLRGRQIIEGDTVEEFWALKDVDFEVRRGDVLGIVGRNGAGKSTLLKILSRITEPSAGRVTLRGRVASLLEVGTGFHPELTGRENIYLNGAILGMTRAEIRTRFDEIVAFAEVEQFLDTPVKRYSSGMYVRLAFAVAAHLDPDVLVVDEVLAVGDAEFQKKCLGRLDDVARAGRTVLFVSHNMNAVEQYCRRVLWLDRGQVKGAFDDVKSGINAYLNSGSAGSDLSIWRNEKREYENSYFRPQWLKVAPQPEGPPLKAPVSNDLTIFISFGGDVLSEDPALNLGIAVYSEDGQLLFWTTFRDSEQSAAQVLDLGYTEMKVSLPPHFLNEGAYRVELIGGLHFREWLFQPMVNCPSVGFSIAGKLSDSPYWLARRPGILAPVLTWDVERPSIPALKCGTGQR